MVTLRALDLDDTPALTRIHSGASIRHTTGKPLTLDQAHDKIRTALARAAETPRAQWSWGILHESDLIGLISLRRRTSAMGTISYILREDNWGHGYATHAAHQVVTVAYTTAGLNRLEAMHHPDNPASGRILAKAGFTRIGTADRDSETGPVPTSCTRWRATATAFPRSTVEGRRRRYGHHHDTDDGTHHRTQGAKGVENGSQSIPWGGEWRRHLRSDAEMDLVRSWKRHVECPTCKAAAGRACRTAGGRPTNEHRARRDAVGPVPYAKWRKEGLIPEQRTYTIPAVLKESEKARADFNVDTALADGVAVVRMFLADRLGLFLQGEEAMDRIDDAVRKLIEVRGPVGTADVVTVLASQVASLLAASAGPDGDPEALFDTMIRAQIDMVRKMNAIEKERADG